MVEILHESIWKPYACFVTTRTDTFRSEHRLSLKLFTLKRELKWTSSSFHSLVLWEWGRYEAYSESKYRFAVKNTSKVSYKILLLSDSTFFRLFFHIFAAIIEALIVRRVTWILRFLDFDNMFFGHLTNNTVSLVPVYQTERRRRDPCTFSQDVCFHETDIYCRHSKNSKSHFWSLFRITPSNSYTFERTEAYVMVDGRQEVSA
jgi:hypothetical protein